MNGKAFAARGEFRGFVTNAEGKRRLLLHTEVGEVACKLPRELRRKFEDALAIGQMLEVEGRDRTDEFTGQEKHIIERLRIVHQPLPASPCAHCEIRICTKKNCWHSGGRALWHFLEERIAAAGQRGAVRLESVRCLDHCKHAPVLAVGKTKYVHCDRDTAGRLLDRLTTG